MMIFQAMNRYQMQPHPSQSTIITSEKCTTAIRSESKAELLTSTKSFKEVPVTVEFLENRDSCAPACDDSKQNDQLEREEVKGGIAADFCELKDDDGEIQDEDISPLNLEHSRDSDIQNPSFGQVEAGPRTTLQGTNFSTFSQLPGHFSANSTGDISNMMDMEGDSEFWNTVNMNHRKVGNEAISQLHPVQESDEVASPMANHAILVEEAPTELGVEVSFFICRLR